MIKSVVFDMDGVLVDSEPFANKIEAEFLQSLGYEHNEELTHKLVGTNMRKAWEMIIDHFQMPHGIEQLLIDYRAFTLERWRSYAELALNPGANELLFRLQKLHLPLGLATSANRHRLDLFLDRLSLKDVFAAIVCGDDIQHSKPAPDIYLKAADQLGVDPKGCVAIEDAKAGVASAKAAGMKVIGYKVPPSKQDLSAADVIIDNFNDVTRDMLNAL